MAHSDSMVDQRTGKKLRNGRNVPDLEKKARKQIKDEERAAVLEEIKEQARAESARARQIAQNDSRLVSRLVEPGEVEEEGSSLALAGSSPHGLSLPEIMKIRTLYLVEGRGPKHIAQVMGLDRDRVGKLVSARGWCKIREKALAESEAATKKIIDADAAAVVEDIARESEEICVSALQSVRSAIDEKSYSGMQAASVCVKNLFSVFRDIRKNESQSPQPANQNTLNLFVFNAEIPKQPSSTPKVVSGASSSEPVNL